MVGDRMSRIRGRDDARDFGERLRRAVHLAGLCARVGVDAGDPGQDRTVSWVNPEVVRGSGALDPDTRIGPDIHGILVLPDDGKTLFLRLGRATGTVRSNVGDFVQALQEAFPESDVSGGDCPSIRRAVRVLNLAEISTDPIAKVVLAVSHHRRVGDRSIMDGRAEEADRECRRLA